MCKMGPAYRFTHMIAHRYWKNVILQAPHRLPSGLFFAKKLHTCPIDSIMSGSYVSK